VSFGIPSNEPGEPPLILTGSGWTGREFILTGREHADPQAALRLRVFSDLRAGEITEYESLGLIAAIERGENPYEEAD
jgi:hypothetical protein